MYAFFDFHKEKVNIFFELFYCGSKANRLAVLQTDWFSVRLVRCSVLLKVMLLLMKKVAA